jgi:hypothetical protein
MKIYTAFLSSDNFEVAGCKQAGDDVLYPDCNWAMQLSCSAAIDILGVSGGLGTS